MSWILKQTFFACQFYLLFVTKWKSQMSRRYESQLHLWEDLLQYYQVPMELRTKWLVWWRLLFKGRLLSWTKVPGSSRKWCFEEQNHLKMGYPSLQAPIFHLIVFTLHSKPLSYPEMQPCSSLQTCTQASVSSTFSARLGVRVRQIPQLLLGLTVSRSHLHRVSTLPLGVLRTQLHF